MSSLYRLVLSALMVGVSFVAFNAYADDSSAQAAQVQASAQPTTTDTTVTTTKVSHHKAVALNLNSADAAALGKVKGIGMRKAQAIVDYRTKNGNFAAVSDLKNVTNAKGKSLFTDAALEKLQKHLTV